MQKKGMSVLKLFRGVCFPKKSVTVERKVGSGAMCLLPNNGELLNAGELCGTGKGDCSFAD